MKKLIVLFVVIFVIALPLIAVKAERDVRAAAERPIVGVHKTVSKPSSGTVSKPKDEDTMPQLSAQECIAILNEDYKRIWESNSSESEQISEVATVTERYGLTDEEREAIEHIVASEGGYCPYEFQALVAECVLNICEADELRPMEVFARGDFLTTNNVAPTEVTKQAVSDVFDKGILPTPEKIRAYYNPYYCSSPWHETLCYVLTSSDCRFFKYWGDE